MYYNTPCLRLPISNIRMPAQSYLSMPCCVCDRETTIDSPMVVFFDNDIFFFNFVGIIKFLVSLESDQMPRHDIKKLRSRLNWIEDYSKGMSASQIVNKYECEGATERKFRTAREAALDLGLLVTDNDLIGTGFKINNDVLNRIKPHEKDQVEKTKEPISHKQNSEKSHDSKIDAYSFEEDEIRILKDIIKKWRSRGSEFEKRPSSNVDAAHWIKINKPLLEMCALHAKRSNISMDRLVTMALMEYLKTNRISAE